MLKKYGCFLRVDKHAAFLIWQTASPYSLSLIKNFPALKRTTFSSNFIVGR
jgi:hypothetical protein